MMRLQGNITLHKNRVFLSIFVLLLSLVSGHAQSYPPSCTITMPFNNAYYKAGTDIDIRVYATDAGKSANNGTVSLVEFYNGNTKMGTVTSQLNNTYSYLWKAVPAGTYTIRVRATNSNHVSFTSADVVITVGNKEVALKGLSAGKGKYLANIMQRTASVNYDMYWNGVTAENACKWGSVEAIRGQYDWAGADTAYHYATGRNMMFRYHAGIWASQYPTWLLPLNTEEARAAVVKHLATIAARFPLADQIDLLNEQLNNHQKDNQKFRELLGGPGTTANDYSWQIWLFEQARKLFPNTKLILNDYGMEGDPKSIKAQLELFKVLRDRGLVDGFGTQAHAFNVDRPAADTIKASLDLMASSGLPIFVTELDMNGGIRGRQVNDSLQLKSYQKAFPVFWEHPAVAGITMWGYITGSTWMSGTGTVSKEGVENPSMAWLKNYLAGRPTIGYPLYPVSKGNASKHQKL